MTEFWNLFLIGLVANCAIMFLCWLWAKRIDNYCIVDAVWSLSFAVQALIYAGLSDGWVGRKILLLSIVGLWSLRLGIFLAIRIYNQYPKEDVRYQEIRKKYGAHVERGFFWFFQFQGWSVSFLSVPFLLISINPVPEFNLWEMGGALIWLVGVAGEALADHQKSEFRKKHKGKNCEVGLWRYSRHPNYFFESVIWWGFFILAVGSPSGGYSLFAPLTMLLLLTKVTGVPLSEKHSLKSCGEEFAAYQKRVSVFVPWFRKT